MQGKGTKEMSTDSWDLEGRTALVCGASRGIGRATATMLAERGAALVVLARSSAALEDLLATVPKPRKAGQHHRMLCADMGNTQEFEHALKTLLAQGVTIDIVVNNTGGPPGGPLVTAPPQALLDAFRQHVIATQIMVTTIAPGMMERRWGRVINVLSTSVRVPIAGLGVSNTMRAAMAAHAKTLSLELAPYGITVNNVLPGYTRTDRLMELAKQSAERTGTSAQAIEEQWLKAVPMGRFGEATELAETIAFLASPAASYITGQSLAVDGGRTGSI